MTDTPSTKGFDLVVRFEGLLDLIHENGSAWIVVPDVSEPARLALHEDVLKENDQLMIAPHVPRMAFHGQPFGSQKSNDTLRVPATPWKIAGSVRFEAEFVDSPFDEVRTPRTTDTPQEGDEASLLWMPDLTDLSQRELRTGLADGTARYQQQHPIVAASVKLDHGTLRTDAHWRTNSNDYWKTKFDGKYSSPRALTRRIALMAHVGSGPVTIRMEPFATPGAGPGAPDSSFQKKSIRLAPLVGEKAVEVLISSHPHPHGHGGERDFAAHYVLRKDSESMSDVALPSRGVALGDGVARGQNPQCTPGDNPP